MCDRDIYPTIGLAALNTGGPIGVYLFGILNDRMGRRVAYFSCLATLLIGSFLTAASIDFWMWAFSRVIVGLTIPAVYQIPFIIGRVFTHYSLYSSWNRTYSAILYMPCFLKRSNWLGHTIDRLWPRWHARSTRSASWCWLLWPIWFAIGSTCVCTRRRRFSHISSTYSWCPSHHDGYWPKANWKRHSRCWRSWQKSMKKLCPAVFVRSCRSAWKWTNCEQEKRLNQLVLLICAGNL